MFLESIARLGCLVLGCLGLVLPETARAELRCLEDIEREECTTAALWARFEQSFDMQAADEAQGLWLEELLGAAGAEEFRASLATGAVPMDAHRLPTGAVIAAEVVSGAIPPSMAARRAMGLPSEDRLALADVLTELAPEPAFVIAMAELAADPALDAQIGPWLLRAGHDLTITRMLDRMAACSALHGNNCSFDDRPGRPLRLDELSRHWSELDSSHRARLLAWADPAPALRALEGGLLPLGGREQIRAVLIELPADATVASPLARLVIEDLMVSVPEKLPWAAVAFPADTAPYELADRKAWLNLVGSDSDADKSLLAHLTRHADPWVAMLGEAARIARGAATLEGLEPRFRDASGLPIRALMELWSEVRHPPMDALWNAWLAHPANDISRACEVKKEFGAEGAKRFAPEVLTWARRALDQVPRASLPGVEVMAADRVAMTEGSLLRRMSCAADLAMLAVRNAPEAAGTLEFGRWLLTDQSEAYRLLGALVLALTGDLEPLVAMAVENEASSDPVRKKFAAEARRAIDQMIELLAERRRSGG